MFCQYRLNVRNLYVCGTLADIKVVVTTEGFMSEVRSWSAPARQMSGRPTVAGTDQLNSKYVTQVEQQRLELPTETLTWHACKYKVFKHQSLRMYLCSGGVYVPCIYTHTR